MRRIIRVRAINTDGSGIKVEQFHIPERVGMDVIVQAPEVEVSDEYHTMDDLYAHRVALFIVLCKQIENRNQRQDFDEISVWRSKHHHTDSAGKSEPMFDDSYVMGIGKKVGEQITYHLPLSTWEYTEFAETLDEAPEFDGHSAMDVLIRLRLLM